MTTQIKQKTVGIPSNLWYSIKALECLAQLGEHFLDVEGVMGSSPLALTIKRGRKREPRKTRFYRVFLISKSRFLIAKRFELSQNRILHLFSRWSNNPSAFIFPDKMELDDIP